MNKKLTYADDPERSAYLLQNRNLHLAREQLNMSLEELRGFARDLGGKPSISSLSLEQRRRLIDILIDLGANVLNPELPETGSSLYLTELEGWQEKFPNPRPGFASPSQLALIEDLWSRFFEDNRPGRGLRGFLVRQCGIDDLSFLKAKDVRRIVTALKVAQRKAKAKGGWR